MPVLSPHRSSASALAGSYRSTFSSSTIDRPYFSSTSYQPRITSYSERYTTRSYADSDGRRIYSRSGSITEDGLTSRFREETTRESSVRRDSLSRDSGISSIRENSIADFSTSSSSSASRRDSSIARSSVLGESHPRLSASNVLDSVAELRSKYSPANYVPACLRERQNENNSIITRSKSINDIGLPPIDHKSPSSSSSSTKKKVNDNNGLTINNSIGVSNNSNNTNDNNKIIMVEDDNGNRPMPSVADLKKKLFDDKQSPGGGVVGRERTSPPQLDIVVEGVKISENRFKKQDDNKRVMNKKLKSDAKKQTGDNHHQQCHLSKSLDVSKLEVNGDCTSFNSTTTTTTTTTTATTTTSTTTTTTTGIKNGIGNQEEESIDLKKSTSRVNNFASYIPSKDYQKGGECVKGSGEETLTVLNGGQAAESSEASAEYGKRFADISTSPKLNSASSRSVVSPSTSTLNSSSLLSSSNSTSSNSLSRRSTDRDNSTSSTSNNYEPTTITSNNKYNNNNNNNNNSVGIINKTLGLNGLKNIGNTCFMNSVIQCLSNTKLLLEYLLKDSYLHDINTTTSSMKGALIRAFAEVIKELWSEDASDRVVNTSSLKSQIQRFAPRFIGYAQQDAQEFLRYLLEGLHEDVNRVKEKPKPIMAEIDEKLSDSEKSAESWSRYLRMDNSKIVDYFVGQLKSTLKCTHCGHCSVTFDPFWDLSLPIPQRAGQVRLAQCLDSFTREETLDGDEKPTCSKCKERRKCTKSFTIQKFPKILVIHLKRFSLAERFRGKLSVTVDFPLEGLDMSHYAADHVTPCRYNLYAISNHSGTTYSGHYTAYCRHPYTKSWHEYNDSRVSPISSKSIVSGEAYVLFYEQEGQKSHL